MLPLPHSIAVLLSNHGLKWVQPIFSFWGKKKLMFLELSFLLIAPQMGFLVLFNFYHDVKLQIACLKIMVLAGLLSSKLQLNYTSKNMSNRIWRHGVKAKTKKVEEIKMEKGKEWPTHTALASNPSWKQCWHSKCVHYCAHSFLQCNKWNLIIHQLSLTTIIILLMCLICFSSKSKSFVGSWKTLLYREYCLQPNPKHKHPCLPPSFSFFINSPKYNFPIGFSVWEMLFVFFFYWPNFLLTGFESTSHLN